jgi:hypothetical protein
VVLRAASCAQSGVCTAAEEQQVESFIIHADARCGRALLTACAVLATAAVLLLLVLVMPRAAAMSCSYVMNLQFDIDVLDVHGIGKSRAQ